MLTTSLSSILALLLLFQSIRAAPVHKTPPAHNYGAPRPVKSYVLLKDLRKPVPGSINDKYGCDLEQIHFLFFAIEQANFFNTVGLDALQSLQSQMQNTPHPAPAPGHAASAAHPHTPPPHVPSDPDYEKVFGNAKTETSIHRLLGFEAAFGTRPVIVRTIEPDFHLSPESVFYLCQEKVDWEDTDTYGYNAATTNDIKNLLEGTEINTARGAAGAAIELHNGFFRKKTPDWQFDEVMAAYERELARASPGEELHLPRVPAWGTLMHEHGHCKVTFGENAVHHLDKDGNYGSGFDNVNTYQGCIDLDKNMKINNPQVPIWWSMFKVWQAVQAHHVEMPKKYVAMSPEDSQRMLANDVWPDNVSVLSLPRLIIPPLEPLGPTVWSAIATGRSTPPSTIAKTSPIPSGQHSSVLPYLPKRPQSPGGTGKPSSNAGTPGSGTDPRKYDGDSWERVPGRTSPLPDDSSERAEREQRISSHAARLGRARRPPTPPPPTSG